FEVGQVEIGHILHCRSSRAPLAQSRRLTYADHFLSNGAGIVNRQPLGSMRSGTSGEQWRMASKRRLGLENSTSARAVLDGVEAVLREDGYAALSAGSVAERAGLKHQLVYYYFQTMDDLLMATYRRHTDRVFERIEAASQSPRPLHAIWDAYS